MQVKTGTFLASYVLDSVQDAINVANHEAATARGRVTYLQEKIHTAAKNLGQEFLGADGQLQIVQNDLDRSKAVVKLAFDRFPWWSLPWKVDDAGTTVRDAIVDEYGRGLEGHVRFTYLMVLTTTHRGLSLDINRSIITVDDSYQRMNA